MLSTNHKLVPFWSFDSFVLMVKVTKSTSVARDSRLTFLTCFYILFENDQSMAGTGGTKFHFKWQLFDDVWPGSCMAEPCFDCLSFSMSKVIIENSKMIYGHQTVKIIFIKRFCAQGVTLCSLIITINVEFSLAIFASAETTC